jgi:hypothetical protein
MNSSAARKISNERSFSAGMELAYEMLNGGANQLSIQNQLLTLGYGKRSVKEILETLEIIRSRPANGAPDLLP